MQIYQSLTPICAPHGSAVALGYFDGVHCGHRAVLGAAVECARAGGLTAAAFTFELPASSTLKGGRILSLAQKHARVASLGIEEYQEAPFDEFRALTPEDFVQKVLVGREIAGNPSLMMSAYAVRGLDINTSYTIYRLLNEQKEQGAAVMYVGEDLDVLLELCDRILVLCAGKVSAIVDGRKARKEEVGLLMTHLGEEAKA